MKSVLKRKTASAGKTPPWLKGILIALLLVSTVAGFLFSAMWVRRPAINIPSFLNKIPSFFNKSAILQKPRDSGDFVVFRDQSGLTEIEIICHGMGVGKDGISRAVIDGMIVAPGAIIRGMKVIEINASNILVECSGRNLRLEPGERVAPVVQTNGSPQPARQIKPSALF